MTRRKPRRKSWTLWFNALASLGAVAELHFEILKAALGDKAYGVAFFAILMINAALRLKTKTALGKPEGS